VNRRLFWLAAGTQGAAVAVLFVVLLLAPLPDDFFKDYGFVAGPVAWALAAVVSWRVLGLPASLIAFAALASGVAGALVGLATTHGIGLVVGVAVFGAACGGYDEGEASAESESATRRA
jgi:hypothetical protein